MTPSSPQGGGPFVPMTSSTPCIAGLSSPAVERWVWDVQSAGVGDAGSLDGLSTSRFCLPLMR